MSLTVSMTTSLVSFLLHEQNVIRSMNASNMVLNKPVFFMMSLNIRYVI